MWRHARSWAVHRPMTSRTTSIPSWNSIQDIGSRSAPRLRPSARRRSSSPATTTAADAYAALLARFAPILRNASAFAPGGPFPFALAIVDQRGIGCGACKAATCGGASHARHTSRHTNVAPHTHTHTFLRSPRLFAAADRDTAESGQDPSDRPRLATDRESQSRRGEPNPRRPECEARRQRSGKFPDAELAAVPHQLLQQRAARPAGAPNTSLACVCLTPPVL